MFCIESVFEVEKCQIPSTDCKIQNRVECLKSITTCVLVTVCFHKLDLLIAIQHDEDLLVPGVVNWNPTGLPHLFHPSRSSKSFGQILESTHISRNLEKCVQFHISPFKGLNRALVSP